MRCVMECGEQMSRLWHKATVIMKMAQCGVRPFVKLVMRTLQKSVVDGLKAQGKPWDCCMGPEKFDAGPDEIEVTSISTDGVFVCKEAHGFQVTKSDPPTALQVVSPSVDLVAAGFFDRQILYVCPSETRALPGKMFDACFKCQTSPTTLAVNPHATMFECTVQSSPPVSFFVMASALDPANSKAVAAAGCSPPAVRIWMVSPHPKKAGFVNRDARKLAADTWVTFADKGSGLPSNIVAGRCYQPTCIDTASFELMPELVSLAAEVNCVAEPLKLRRCETAQRCLQTLALTKHDNGASAQVKWASIKARELSENPNDFAKMFCSGSKDNVDIFETDANGELLFNIMTFCKEFCFFHEFLSASACLECEWTPHQCSFSVQNYWCNTSNNDIKISEPSTKLKELSAQATGNRNGLFHGEMELTATEFERSCTAFVDLLEEVVRVCGLLSSSAAVVDATRSDLAHVAESVKQKIAEIHKRRVSNAPTSLQEQREADELRKQFRLEKQRSEQLEQDKKSLQLQLEGTHESFLATLAKIASFSKCGHQQITSLNRQWASGSRQPLLKSIHDAAAGKHATIVCVHGRHGCGKSSALSQVIAELETESVLVLSHLFMFGDSASSVDVALASLCVQIWQNALQKVMFCNAWFV